MNLVINDTKCRATSGNGSFFSSIEWTQDSPLAESGSWALSSSAVAMVLKIVKKFKTDTINIVEYENCIKYGLGSFDIISLDKFDSQWPNIDSILKRSNDIVISLDVDSVRSMRTFLIPVLEQAQRDKVDIPSISFSAELSSPPSVELQSNFQDNTYFTLNEDFVSIKKNENRASVFSCNISLKSLIDSIHTSSFTKSVEVKLSEDDFNGHSSPVLIEHIDDGGCSFSSFFAQVE